MNRTVNAVMNEQKVDTQELFELVNDFNITSLQIQDSNNTVFKMNINHFEAYGDVFEFSQENMDEGSCSIKQSDILSVDARWEEMLDSITIICKMTENKKLSLVTYYVSKDFSVSRLPEYEEMSLSYFDDFLEKSLKDEGEYYCALVKVMDKFSVFLKMTSPQRAFINKLDDSDWKLHIGDNISELDISVMDDSYNAFYYKKSDSSVEIVIKPYGQPFMEVRMLFFKKQVNQ